MSRHRFWLLLGDKELLVPCAAFPWFKQTTIEPLSGLRWPMPDHRHWPQPDADLSVASIRDPAAFPLLSKLGT